MKKRNPLVVLLLTLVTLGIYSIFWLYYTRKEINQALNNPKAVPPVLFLFLPWLIVIAAVLLGAAIDALTQNAPVIDVLLGILIIVSAIAGFIYPFFWVFSYSQAVHSLVPETDTGQIYALWLVTAICSVGFVWPLLVQVELNKYIDRQNGVLPPAQAPAPAPAPRTGQSLHQSAPAQHASDHHSRRQTATRPHHDSNQLPPSPVQE